MWADIESLAGYNEYMNQYQAPITQVSGLHKEKTEELL